VLGDKVLGLFLGPEILGDPFPGLGFGRRNLNAPAFGMLVVTWRHVFTSVYLKNLSRMAELLSRIKDT
jgi:hypothetical protein